MSDPISRLQLARQEIDHTFGDGYAAAHPELVAVVMQSASSDTPLTCSPRAIEHVAEALLGRTKAPLGVFRTIQTPLSTYPRGLGYGPILTTQRLRKEIRPCHLAGHVVERHRHGSSFVRNAAGEP